MRAPVRVLVVLSVVNAIRPSPAVRTQESLSLDVEQQLSAAAARSALLTSCIVGSKRYFERSNDYLFEGLDSLLSSYAATVGGHAYVFTLPDSGNSEGPTIQSIARSNGAIIWEVPEETTYHGYTVPVGSMSRHVHYLEWVAAKAHQYDRVIVADCADVAMQSDPFEVPAVAKDPAQVYLFREPNEAKAHAYFQRHGELCYSQDFCQDIITEKMQVNSGFWMGMPKGVAAVSELMLLEAVHCGHFLWDQHFLNVVVQMKLKDDPRVRLVGEETLAGVMAKLDNASAFQVTDNFVVNRAKASQPYAALHQYNWHQKMDLAVRVSKAARKVAPSASARPKIHVYQATAALNAQLRKALVPAIEGMEWTTVLTEFLAEVRLHEGLLAHKEWLTEDPRDADVLFVPCYAWLAFQCTAQEVKQSGVDVCALQKQLVKQTVAMLSQSVAWQRKRPHVFVHGSTRKMEEVFPYGLADFVNAPHATVATLEGANGDTRVNRYSFKPRDIVIPYVIPLSHVHHVDRQLAKSMSDDRWKPLKIVMHASPNHPVRQRLVDAFSKGAGLGLSKSMELQGQALAAGFSDSTIRASLNDVVSGTFCLTPRGLTSTARRFYEAVLAACIPVVVGDQFSMAYEEVLPSLSKAVVFWPESQIEDLPRYLYDMPQAEIEKRQKLLLSLRYQVLLEAPSHVRWTGVESFLQVLSSRLGNTVHSDSPGKSIASHAAKSEVDEESDSAELSALGAAEKESESGQGTAVLTLMSMPSEHTVDGASAQEMPSTEELSEGLQRFLGSLRSVDPTAQTFVLASKEVLAAINVNSFFSPYNTTVLPFEPHYEYRGLHLPDGNVGRHLLYQKIIKEHLWHFKHVVILDSKDVVFQASPSELFGSHGSTPGQVFAYQEPACQQIRSYWESHAATCYKPFFYKSLPNSAIMNGGVLAGSPKALMVIAGHVAEEALKCYSPTSFLRDQHYLDAVLWSFHSGLLQHKDIKAINYSPHGTKVVMCNHPQDAEMRADDAFAVEYRQDNGLWTHPVVLHQYTNRVQLRRSVDFRHAEQLPFARVSVCAYPGMSFESASTSAELAEKELAERWKVPTNAEPVCDFWFMPLCGTPTIPLQQWADKQMSFKQHPGRHVYVWPGKACRSRAGVTQLLEVLKVKTGIPIYVGGAVPRRPSLRGMKDSVMAPALLPKWEYAACTRQLGKSLNAISTVEDAMENRKVLRNWKQTLLFAGIPTQDAQMLNSGGVTFSSQLTGEEFIAKMARATYCLMPQDFASEWLVRAVLVSCIPVVQKPTSLPFEDIFDPSHIFLTWEAGKPGGLTKFLERIPEQQVERMQSSLARYRAALRMRGVADQGQDVWEAVRLSLERCWLAEHDKNADQALKERKQEAKVDLPPQSKLKVRNAYFLSPFDANYVPGACRLLQSLGAVGTIHPVVVFLVKGIDLPYHNLVELAICGSSLDLHFRAVEPYEPFNGGTKRAGMGLSWTRLRYFEQDDFDRVLQLEVDTLVNRNLDWVFNLQFPSRFYAVANCNSCESLREQPRSTCLSMLHLWMPQATWNTVQLMWTKKDSASGWESRARGQCGDDLIWPDPFNAGVFLFQPSRELFHRMQRQLKGAEPEHYPYADQDFFNEFFPDWLSLPEEMNAQVREVSAHAPSKGWNPSIAVFHWPGKTKPWAVDESWPLLTSRRPPASQLFWFGAADKEQAASDSPSPCGGFSRLLIQTCATDASHHLYRQWRALVGQPDSNTKIDVQNVCRDRKSIPTSTGTRLSLYHQGLASLPREEMERTLVVQADSYDVIPNWIGLSEDTLISQLVDRFEELVPSCDKVVMQAEYDCYVGRPCTLQETRRFNLRKDVATNLRNFPNAGLVLGGASKLHSMETEMLKAVQQVGSDLKDIRDQPLFHGYVSARPDHVVLDSHQLLFGSFQSVRLNSDGRVTAAENNTEQCHAYKNGMDKGSFVCMSKASPHVPCCLQTVIGHPAPRVSRCTLLLPDSDDSVDRPFFVHGQGPYKEPVGTYGATLLKSCQHHESLRHKLPQEE